MCSRMRIAARRFIRVEPALHALAHAYANSAVRVQDPFSDAGDAPYQKQNSDTKHTLPTGNEYARHDGKDAPRTG
ncbi:hypothetical protein NDU88_005966 [Pleurodeles waltl]|uniref:Uncharacterized protein n=1 Tax=Pleurodeles waltl TaxID=8319 RepID=A0AAV7RNZ4_PLEWA|nr:hypothetical protein NDU88_005966 [Pleurodeles waltl]